jgi:hypothetical protein
MEKQQLSQPQQTAVAVNSKSNTNSAADTIKRSRSYEDTNVFELEIDANDDVLEQNNSSVGTGAETNSSTLDRSTFNTSEDDESTDNRETTATAIITASDQSNSAVLKKRNSNVGSETNVEVGGQLDETNARLNRQQQPLSNTIKMNKQNSYGAFRQMESRAQSKYSSSLPRDIPYMPLKLNLAIKKTKNSTLNDGDDDDDDDAFKSSDEEEENRGKYAPGEATSKQKQKSKAATSIRFKQENEMISHYGDDELFENEEESYDEEPVKNGRQIQFNLNGSADERRPAPDYSQAISDLASSIVMKDGSELFGERPSRRVHINSISKSFF